MQQVEDNVNDLAKDMKAIFDETANNYEGKYRNTELQAAIGEEVAITMNDMGLENDKGHDVVRRVGELCHQEDKDLDVSEFNRNAIKAFNKQVEREEREVGNKSVKNNGIGR